MFRTASILFALSLLAALVGCDAYAPTFRANAVYARRLETSSDTDLTEAIDEIRMALESVFGTPEEPLLPKSIIDDVELGSLLQLENLQRAAGPVKSEKDGTNRGLFRKHCSNCHGLSGDGAGPTSSFLNPYPRDYRVGVFKFKSTRNGVKPTREDMVRTLKHGLCGTSMPAFDLEPAEDIEALTDYVIYLTMRGEVERELLREAVDLGYGDIELTTDERLWPRDAESSDPAVVESKRAKVQGLARDAARRWLKATDYMTPVHARSGEDLAETSGPDSKGDALAQSVQRGQELFHGKVANCSVCHGKEGVGDGLENDYDDWTKEWTLRIGIDPKDPKKKSKIKEFIALGAHKPRNISPRNFQTGAFRGGAAREDIYRRIVQGIDGTPMPAVNLVETKTSVGLTSDQVWDVVNYVLSLSNRQQTKDE